MVLVDTSVWVAHLRGGNIGMEAILNEGQVVCHPFNISELACGNLKNRSEILSLLQALPMAIHARHEEVMQFIENPGRIGIGLDYLDLYFLVSAILTNIPLWKLD